MPIPIDRAKPSARKLIADEIYESLRRMIIEGELQPGEPLREIELSEYFDASRTPVHEAIAKLGLHGFVELQAQRGGRVAPVSAQSFREALAINGALLKTVYTAAIPLLTAEDRDRLAALRLRLDEAKPEGLLHPDDSVYLDIIAVFEERYGNQIMTETLRRTWPHIFRAFNMFPEPAAELHAERRAFLEALIEHSIAGDTVGVTSGHNDYREHVLTAFVAAMDDADTEKGI